MITGINASAAVTLLEQRPEKIQVLSGIRTHELCDAGAVLSQLSYQSHMRAVVYGLVHSRECVTHYRECVTHTLGSVLHTRERAEIDEARSDPIHLIPKWPPFFFPFVYLQISPCCLVLKLEIQKNIFR